MTRITHEIARHIVETQFEDLPDEAVRSTKEHILYTIGTALAGSGAPGIPQLRKACANLGEAGPSSILVHGQSAAPHMAAFVNAAMAHSRELDINDDRIAYKSSVAVVPASCAMAQALRPVSGRDLITAVCVGIDLGIRLGLATRPKPTHSRFIALGPIASAAACAKLMKLDLTAVHDALGIAYCRSTVSGNSLMSPSLTKRLGAGFASQSGVVAATLAEAGFPATTEIFAGPEGFFLTFYGEEGDHASLLSDLGRQFEIVSVGPKPYPSCRYTHAGVNAALALRAAHGRTTNETIRSIKVYVGDRDMRFVCGVNDQERRKRTNPTGVVDAQFSVPYTVAAALVRGHLTLNEFTDEAFCDRDILSVAERIETIHEASFDAWPLDVTPQAVEIVFTDGRVAREQVDYPKGSAANPFTLKEIEDSFRHMAAFAGLRPELANHTIAQMQHLEQLDDAADLIDALSGQAARETIR